MSFYDFIFSTVVFRVYCTAYGGWNTSPGYKSVADGLVYVEAWDETAEFLISGGVKESKVEKSGIGGVKIKSSEMGSWEGERSEERE